MLSNEFAPARRNSKAGLEHRVIARPFLQSTMVTYHDPNDPFLILLAPPRDETPEQCKAREAEEEAARKVSLRIDEELKAEKAAIKKKKNGVKVLVLGQSESGMCSRESYSACILNVHCV
jgi:hypothetical protein